MIRNPPPMLRILVEPDNMFFCYEKSGGIEADYSGTWELKRDRIGLCQKIRDGRPEEDELVGTIDGDRMELVHNNRESRSKLFW